MNWKVFGVSIVFVVGALFALGCSETTVLPPGSEGTAGISVSGTGSVFGQPDVAVLTVGVEAQAESVGAARDQAAGAMDAVLAALRDGGVEDDDIQTTRFSVQPRYTFQDGDQQLIGFFVDNIVTAKIRNIDDTGDLIDAAVAAGGDLARIEDLRFTIDDPAALEDEARRLAMEDAGSRAETLADAGGVALGQPRSISESGGAVPIPFEALRADAAFQEGAADTPISVGELEVVINVQVLYDLE